jgi:hypothetical protein
MHKRVLWFVLRVCVALLLFVFCCVLGAGCGSVTPIDVEAGSDGGGETHTVEASPDHTTASQVGPEGDAGTPVADASPLPSDVMEVGLPICPPEIMWYDCPQPKCDCQGRKAP